MKTFYFFAVLLSSLFVGCTPTAQESASGTTPAEEDFRPYMVAGKEIAQSTFAAMSSQLQAAMASGGVSNAVQYCNVKAYPITDSMARVHQAAIRRTSLQYRNPANAPTPDEKRILERYAEQHQRGDTLRPLVEGSGADQVTFYAPIMLKPLCVSCHGTPGETLTEENHALIKELYPDDQAVGYAPGDLRGIWSITFPKAKVEKAALIQKAPVQEKPVKELGPDAYEKAFKALENPVLLDVRTPREFAQGHITGAINIDVQGRGFREQIRSLDPEQVYFVNCRSGIRSARACKIMVEEGFTQLINLEGGMLGWEAAGKPTEK